MAARRLPPELQALGQRLLHEVGLSLARASSATFRSLAEDARRIPQIVQEEASKLEGRLNDFIATISNEAAPGQNTEQRSSATKPRKKRKKTSQRQD